MTADHTFAFDCLMPRIAGKVAAAGGRLFVLGLCGAQGSGKSTLARQIVDHFNGQGISSAVLSLDDLYQPRAVRQAMARQVHPLLATRGVPGTHDVPLGLAVMAALRAGQACFLPRFDKAADDRLPAEDWPRAPAGLRLLVFEGWCVGARPQAEAALAWPVNALEREADADGLWRRHVNAALAGHYQALFATIDMLVFLAAPDFAIVGEWRREQEAALRAKATPGAPGLMDDAAIERFIQHYERLTRHLLTAMPDWADLTLWLETDRSLRSVSDRAADRT